MWQIKSSHLLSLGAEGLIFQLVFVSPCLRWWRAIPSRVCPVLSSVLTSVFNAKKVTDSLTVIFQCCNILETRESWGFQCGGGGWKKFSLPQLPPSPCCSLIPAGSLCWAQQNKCLEPRWISCSAAQFSQETSSTSGSEGCSPQYCKEEHRLKDL